MLLERSRYGEYGKVKYKTLASFQILDPKEQQSVLFSQGSQNSSNWGNEGFDIPLFKSAKVINFLL